MKKPLIVLSPALLLAVACAPQDRQEVGLANPAATYCAERGGTYGLEAGTCTLSDGRVVDAWEFFRAQSGAGG